MKNVITGFAISIGLLYGAVHCLGVQGIIVALFIMFMMGWVNNAEEYEDG